MTLHYGQAGDTHYTAQSPSASVLPYHPTTQSAYYQHLLHLLPSIRPLGNSHNAWLNGEYQHHIIIQVAKNGTTGSRDIRSGIPLRAGNVGLIVIDYSLSQSSRRRVREGLRKLGVGVKDGINCLKRTGSILCPEIWCLLFALS